MEREEQHEHSNSFLSGTTYTEEIDRIAKLYIKIDAKKRGMTPKIKIHHKAHDEDYFL
jgi:hypothetical protein